MLKFIRKRKVLILNKTILKNMKGCPALALTQDGEAEEAKPWHRQSGRHKMACRRKTPTERLLWDMSTNLGWQKIKQKT